MSTVKKLLSILTRSPDDKSFYEREMQLRSEIAFQDIYILLVRTYESHMSSDYLDAQEEMIVQKFRGSPETDLKSLCIKYLSDKAKFSLPEETISLIKDRLRIAGYNDKLCGLVVNEFESNIQE